MTFRSSGILCLWRETALLINSLGIGALGGAVNTMDTEANDVGLWVLLDLTSVCNLTFDATGTDDSTGAHTGTLDVISAVIITDFFLLFLILGQGVQNRRQNR